MFRMLCVIMLASALTSAGDVEIAVAHLKKLEGFRSERYWDRSRWSIGYGTAAKPGETTITREEATRRLLAECVIRRAYIQRHTIKQLSEHQRAALIVFVYNVGLGTYRRSALLRRLNGGDYAAVPHELRKFVYSGKTRVPGLVRRREAEVRIWQQG